MSGKRLAAILFFLILTSCSKDYVTGKSSYNWFKMDHEVGLGKNVLDQQTGEFKKEGVKIDQDARQLQRLKTIVQKIARVSHMPDLPYEVHLAEAPVVNAWAAPGGKIMVYSGLWDPQKGLVNQNDDAEIAAVLAHEITHATARHVTESLSQNMTLAVAGAAVTSIIDVSGSARGADLFGKVFSTGFNLYVPSYSRKNESEADRIGLFYMAKAGYDPRAAIRVWKRAAQKRGDEASIYASHPASGERAKALEAYLPQALEIYQHPERPYPDFKQLGKK